jgi:hypothetical protein
MLRMESANQEIDGRPLPQLGEDSRPKTRQGFGMYIITLSLLRILTKVLFRLAEELG